MVWMVWALWVFDGWELGVSATEAGRRSLLYAAFTEALSSVSVDFFPASCAGRLTSLFALAVARSKAAAFLVRTIRVTHLGHAFDFMVPGFDPIIELFGGVYSETPCLDTQCFRAFFGAFHGRCLRSVVSAK